MTEGETEVSIQDNKKWKKFYSQFKLNSVYLESLGFPKDSILYDKDQIIINFSLLTMDHYLVKA